MKPFFFQTTLLVEEGPAQGERWLYKVRVLADSEVEARRGIIGWIAAQNEVPPPPAGVSQAEVDHIVANWNKLRVQHLEPCEPIDLRALEGVYPGRPIYWWDHVVLPAAGEG
jgi:hypothetical protein